VCPGVLPAMRTHDVPEVRASTVERRRSARHVREALRQLLLVLQLLHGSSKGSNRFG
jgi:hypothetical protein